MEKVGNSFHGTHWLYWLWSQSKHRMNLGQQHEVSQACSCWEEAALPVTLGRKFLVRTDASLLFSSEGKEEKEARASRLLQTSFNYLTSPKPPCQMVALLPWLLDLW